MAKTTQEYYDIIWNEVSSFAELAAWSGFAAAENARQLSRDLVDNPSRFNRFRLLVWGVATVVATLDRIFDSHKAEVEEIAAASKVGSEAFLADAAKEFRWNANASPVAIPHFYSLNASYRIAYTAAALSDAEALIVKAAVCRSTSGIAQVLVAGGSPGNYSKLPEDQVTGINAYLNDVAFAGQFTQALSYDPDSVLYTLSVKFDEIRGEEATRLAIIAAAREYHANLLFGSGKVNFNDFIDRIQAIPGRPDVLILLAEARTAVGAYNAFIGEYEPVAGYAIFDDLSAINMIPR